MIKPLDAKAIAAVLQYAIENEINHMTEDDIYEAALGATDQIIEWWDTLDQTYLHQIQTQINAALKGFFNKEEIL